MCYSPVSMEDRTTNSECESHEESRQSPDAKEEKTVLVEHNYHDYSFIEESDDTKFHLAVARSVKEKGGINSLFPLRLHELLDRAEDDGFSDVISWQPHGRSFIIHDHFKFRNVLLPHYLGSVKASSFQRQLNLYGFSRITKGRDKGGYYHELFLRGMPQLAHRMLRKTVKGSGFSRRANPKAEPNFWLMKWVGLATNTRPVGSHEPQERKPAWLYNTKKLYTNTDTVVGATTTPNNLRCTFKPLEESSRYVSSSDSTALRYQEKNNRGTVEQRQDNKFRLAPVDEKLIPLRGFAYATLEKFEIVPLENPSTPCCSYDADCPIDRKDPNESQPMSSSCRGRAVSPHREHSQEERFECRADSRNFATTVGKETRSLCFQSQMSSQRATEAVLAERDKSGSAAIGVRPFSRPYFPNGSISFPSYPVGDNAITRVASDAALMNLIDQWFD